MTMTDQIHIRPFDGLPDCHACANLQRLIWGGEPTMDEALLLVVMRHGGIAIGGFDAQNTMLGFAVSILSTAHDPHANRGLSQHSHIAAVLPEYKSSGLGARLKLAQKDVALARGINLMTWTFDPLESLNAAFNLRKLGAIGRVYLVNAYGVMDDELNRGIPSDRFEAEWWMDGSQPWRNGAQTPSAKMEIEIPLDFQALKRKSLDEALAWRMKTRAQFLAALGDGYVAVGHAIRDDRSFHLLEKY